VPVTDYCENGSIFDKVLN